jgi:hypothetical protein
MLYIVMFEDKFIARILNFFYLVICKQLVLA